MSIHRLPGAVLAAFMLLSIQACSPDNGPILSAPDAYEQARAGKLTLIDVRTPEEWRKTGVAQGALRIDMTNAQGEAGFTRQVEAALGGNRHQSIGLIGFSANRSANAQGALLEAGFSRVYNIKEGMLGSSAGPGWIARKLPVDPCTRC